MGVNEFTDGDEERPLTLYIDDTVEERQLKRLAEIKQARDGDHVRAALARLRADAADPSVNVMPGIMEAVKAYATVGEVITTLESVFGTWVEQPLV